MGSENKRIPLGELCDPERGITYGIVKVGDFVAGGVPIVRGGDIRQGKIVFDDHKRVTEEVSNQFQRTILRGGEIVINLIAEPGHTAIVPPSLAGANVSRDVGVIALGEGVDHRYVDYYLKSPDAVRWLTSRLQGSVTQKINLGTLRELPIPIPARSVQQSIARILGALDDKIELNRKMNATLEAMARALFKSWFVDFDPVRAKAEGRAPSGIDEETAKLFPSEFVKSEFGMIPRGWRPTRLGAEAARGKGGIQTGPFGSQLHASDYVREGVPVVMPKDIVGRRVSEAGIARVREADAERLARHRLQVGDIVYSRRGDVERHALISQREASWLCGTGCLLVRLGSQWPSAAFASFALDRSETRAWIVQHAIGATMPNLNTGILGDVPLLMPSDLELAAFARFVDPIQARLEQSAEESFRLSALRDELLPRLLSREVIALEQLR
jgi:type I restriction enzyme, S subunit